jgi:hypothetical protein
VPFHILHNNNILTKKSAKPAHKTFGNTTNPTKIYFRIYVYHFFASRIPKWAPLYGGDPIIHGMCARMRPPPMQPKWHILFLYSFFLFILYFIFNVIWKIFKINHLSYLYIFLILFWLWNHRGDHFSIKICTEEEYKLIISSRIELDSKTS